MKDYFTWLCELLDGDGKYNRLLNTLYYREFIYSVPNDANRAFEGVEIRRKYCKEMGIKYEPLSFKYQYCTILELLLGLAYRCEDIMSDQREEVSVQEWFWKLLSNLHISEYDDENFNESKANLPVNRIIDRAYERNGEGGIFPLKYTKKDQRRVELWYQMNEYLVENYFS